VVYQDRASLTLDPREGGGTRVTIVIPRDREPSRPPMHEEAAVR
jgi:hypothetical protein